MNDNEFIISAKENGIERKNYTFEGEAVTKNIVLDDTIAKNRQEINDLKENSATKAELNQLDQEIKNVKSYSRSAFIFCFWLIMFFVFSMLAVLLFAPDLNSTKDTITPSANSEAESDADTIIEELGLPISKDYEEFNHDSTDHDYLFDWALADGTRISNQYKIEYRISFDTDEPAGIDEDAKSYIFIYDYDSGRLIYKATPYGPRGFGAKKYYLGTDGGVVNIVAYQTNKDDEVFRKDTFNNISIKDYND